MEDEETFLKDSRDRLPRDVNFSGSSEFAQLLIVTILVNRKVWVPV